MTVEVALHRKIQAVMGKTLLDPLLKVGRISGNPRDQIEKGGAALQDEEIGVSVTFRRFHTPGKRFGWKRK